MRFAHHQLIAQMGLDGDLSPLPLGAGADQKRKQYAEVTQRITLLLEGRWLPDMCACVPAVHACMMMSMHAMRTTHRMTFLGTSTASAYMWHTETLLALHPTSQVRMTGWLLWPQSHASCTMHSSTSTGLGSTSAAPSITARL